MAQSARTCQSIFAQPTSADDIGIISTITVPNTGKVAVSEIVQIYVTDTNCTFRRPKQELKGFAKVTLGPGESKKVAMSIDKQALTF